jgi:stage III sporulation protein AA
MITEAYTITDNLDDLLAVLPTGLQHKIAADDRAGLLEIVLDLGRQPEARFADRSEYLRVEVVTREELDFVESKLGAFGDDNRAGLPATLHRISALRNRRGVIVGLTLRVGRAVSGIVDILRDLIESGQSILLMGRPGLGKTTLLREMARVLADEMGKRVVIVDTSNEIAGDGDVPHPAIGRARRMQVPRVAQQHDVMIEAVENHMPEVIVIDEIGRSEEALASRTIAERGVQLIATVHGNTLENLLANPTMSDLIGGIQAVTLSDEEARRRGTQKTVLERKAPATFDVVAEMISRNEMAVRRPVDDVVDAILRGRQAPPEIRRRDEQGEIVVEMPPRIEYPAQVSERRSESHRSRDRGGNRAGQGRRQNGRTGERRRDEYSRPEKSHDWGNLRHSKEHPAAATRGTNGHGHLRLAPSSHEEAEEDRSTPAQRAANETILALRADMPLDVSRISSVYPFGLSRSRLARAIKHLGLPLRLARRWQEADGVLLAAGDYTFAADSSFLRDAREQGLTFIAVTGNTYGQIVSRLSQLYGESEGPTSPRELAVKEAQSAAQRVLAEAAPAELRPQIKPLRRLQHQLAEKYHLRSYSVGREPNRRVRFLPRLARQ